MNAWSPSVATLSQVAVTRPTVCAALVFWLATAAPLAMLGCGEPKDTARDGSAYDPGDAGTACDGGACPHRAEAGGRDDGVRHELRLAWSRVSQGPYAHWATATAIDAAGEVVVLGHAFGPVDLGGGSLGGDGRYDFGFFVARYDRNGSHRWSRRFGAGGGDFKGLALDAEGNVLVAGTFAGELDLASGPRLHAHGEKDGVVLKLTPSGEVVWARQFGGFGHCMPQQLAVDAGGRAVVVGRVRGSVDFGDGARNAAGWDLFLLGLDDGGHSLWSELAGDASDQFGHDIALLPGGEMVMGARLAGRLALGGGSVECAAATCFALLKLDQDRRFLWGQSFANLPEAAIAAGSDGSIVFAGTLAWPTDFGGGTLTPAGYPDALLVKLDKDGRHLFSQRFGNQWSWQWASDVAVDGAGNVWLAGGFTGEVDFGGGALVSARDFPYQEHSDAFVALFDATGRHLMSRGYGGPDQGPTEENADGVAASASGEAVVVGRFVGTIDFGTGPHLGGGEWRTFVARWTRD